MSRMARRSEVTCNCRDSVVCLSVEGVKVSEIMSRPVITVTEETGIQNAARLLVDRGISTLPVLDSEGRLVGIVSEADLLQIGGRAPKSVAEVMTRNVLTISDNGEVSQAARLMLDAGIRRVVVVRGRRAVGIVSCGDLVKLIARRDSDIETEIGLRLGEMGLGTTRFSVSVQAGVASITLDDDGSARELAESAALTVPGVLKVDFT